MTKFIAIAGALLIPFIIIWVVAGFLWAILAYFIVGGIILMGFVGARRRRRVYYVDDYDEEIIMTRRPTPSRSDIERWLRWHVPKVNKNGVEFITGASSLRRVQKQDMKINRKGAEFITGAKGLRKAQQDAMKRTRKNLWG